MTKHYRPRPLDLSTREGIAQAFDWTAWHAPEPSPLGDLQPRRDKSLWMADLILHCRRVGDAAAAAEFDRMCHD